jgi:hypothetical protein
MFSNWVILERLNRQLWPRNSTLEAAGVAISALG